VKGQIKTIFLLGMLSAMLIAVGGALGSAYLYGFTVLALLMNLGAYFFSDRLVLTMHRAEEIPRDRMPWLYAMTEELAGRANIPPPRLYLIPGHQPNAFATGRNPKHGVVAVTEGLLSMLDRRELCGVLAHEIAHIRNRDILVSTIAATIAAAITYIANIIQFSALFGSSSDEERSESLLGGLLFAFVAPIAAMLVQLGISRSREYLADETGARLAQDPVGLARALEKLEMAATAVPMQSSPATSSLFIVNPLAGSGGILKWFSTHPPSAERIRRLYEMR
jgi:heat shock protein HtpX